MKIKTSELKEGAQLDYAVALCEGVSPESFFMAVEYMKRRLVNPTEDEIEASHVYQYSTAWSDGGPIIERELLVLSPDPSHNWLCRSYMDATEFYGPTPLSAAMRCFVASRYGDEIDIPEELI